MNYFYEHYAGDVYTNGQSEYILAMVDGKPGQFSSLNLISLSSGNRWADPIKIDTTKGRDADKLTEEEFSLLIGLHPGIAWSMIRRTMSASLAQLLSQIQ